MIKPETNSMVFSDTFSHSLSLSILKTLNGHVNNVKSFIFPTVIKKKILKGLLESSIKI